MYMCRCDISAVRLEGECPRFGSRGDRPGAWGRGPLAFRGAARASIAGHRSVDARREPSSRPGRHWSGGSYLRMVLASDAGGRARGRRPERVRAARRSRVVLISV